MISRFDSLNQTFSHSNSTGWRHKEQLSNTSIPVAAIVNKLTKRFFFHGTSHSHSKSISDIGFCKEKKRKGSTELCSFHDPNAPQHHYITNQPELAASFANNFENNATILGVFLPNSITPSIDEKTNRAQNKPPAAFKFSEDVPPECVVTSEKNKIEVDKFKKIAEECGLKIILKKKNVTKISEDDLSLIAFFLEKRVKRLLTEGEKACRNTLSQKLLLKHRNSCNT